MDGLETDFFQLDALDQVGHLIESDIEKHEFRDGVLQKALMSENSINIELSNNILKRTDGQVESEHRAGDNVFSISL